MFSITQSLDTASDAFLLMKNIYATFQISTCFVSWHFFLEIAYQLTVWLCKDECLYVIVNSMFQKQILKYGCIIKSCGPDASSGGESA